MQYVYVSTVLLPAAAIVIYTTLALHNVSAQQRMSGNVGLTILE